MADEQIIAVVGATGSQGGGLGIAFPVADKKLPDIAAHDIGRRAHGIFKAGDECIGKTVGIAGEHLTGTQMAAALGKALGHDVGYADVPPEVYRGPGFPVPPGVFPQPR